MPVFDKSQVPPEFPLEIVDAVNAVIERLRGRLVQELVLPERLLGLRVPNLVRGYLQAHLRRILAFLDGGYAEYLAGRPIMTEVATRAIYENVATVCDFIEKLKPLCEAVNYDGIEGHARKAAFATRVPSILDKHGEDWKAPNILGQIDRMVKRVPTFREAYDHLSDIVHSNGLGALIYFATLPGDKISFADGAVTPERLCIRFLWPQFCWHLWRLS
jgi:hypothetical protein